MWGALRTGNLELVEPQVSFLQEASSSLQVASVLLKTNAWVPGRSPGSLVGVFISQTCSAPPAPSRSSRRSSEVSGHGHMPCSCSSWDPRCSHLATQSRLQPSPSPDPPPLRGLHRVRCTQQWKGSELASGVLQEMLFLWDGRRCLSEPQFPLSEQQGENSFAKVPWECKCEHTLGSKQWCDYGAWW